MGYPYLVLYVRNNKRKVKNTLLYKHKLDIKKEDSFSITYELVESLIYPFIERRSLNGLCTKTIRKTGFTLKREPEKVTIDLHTKNYPRLGNNRRRCYKCIEQFHSKEEKKSAAKNREQCMYCGKSVCCDHSIVICDSCNVKKEV